MMEGIRRAGDLPVLFDQAKYCRPHAINADVAVFYGLEGNLPDIMGDFAQRRAAVYIDLGYWGRREGGRWSGYHKIVINARHPNAYYADPVHPPDRFQKFRVPIKPFARVGLEAPILLAGMGDKGAYAEGFEPEAWERWAIAEIRKYTDRPIRYRPKPSWKEAKPIEGVEYSSREREVEQELEHCWAVVTHHSNVAVDAILAGVPAFCWGGVGRDRSCQDLSKIEDPEIPTARDQWAADIAYTQWNIAEMRSGAPWRHLRKENLV